MIALYVRVSTEDQAEHGYSIGEQKERLTEYCHDKGWMDLKIYDDAGYSGGTMDRPALNRLIHDAESGLVSKVVVWKLDRLSRSMYDSLYLIKKVFEPHGVECLSASEPFDTASSNGEFMLGIFANFAQLERSKIKERMTIGKEGAAKAGHFNGGTVPIGYNYNTMTKRLEVNEFEKLQVLEVYDLFLSGMPVKTIENTMRNKGYKHKHGEWTAKAIKRVVGNPLYIGKIRYKGGLYDGLHQPLVDKETYDKAVALLEDRKIQYQKFKRNPREQKSLLGGLIWCARCGARYGRKESTRRSGKKVYYYTCYSRSKSMREMIRDPECKNKSWNTEELDNIILGEIKKLVIDPDLIKTPDRQDIEEKNAVIEAEIARIDRQINRLIDLYATEILSADELAQRIEPLKEQKERLASEIQVFHDNTDQFRSNLRAFADIVDSVQNDNGVCQQLVGSLCNRIEIDGDDITIHWNL